MRVLVACESSGVVRDAFRLRGHDAFSCDLLPADSPSPFHIRGDAMVEIRRGWDLIIAHPPCTDLASSGARWFAEKKADGRQGKSIKFFLDMMRLIEDNSDASAVENPIGVMSRLYRKPDQIIQPWMFGHGETKATCLWLRNLPLLVPTDVVEGREGRIWKMSPGPLRWKERSRRGPGIGNAMANQWGRLE